MGLLDPPAAPAGRFRIVERDQPVPVATRASAPFDSSTGLSAVDVKGTAKLQHKMVRTAHGLQLAFTNWGALSTTEADGPADITVRASIEYPANQMFQLTFGGRKSVVIEPGCTALSDPLGVTLPKGATFWTRTYVQPVSGGKIFRAGFITTSSGEGHNYDGAATDLTAPGSASLTGIGGSQRVYGPAMILGRAVDPGKPVIGAVGNSIGMGTGDNDIGYFQRSLADNYSFQKVCFPGEAFFAGTTSSAPPASDDPGCSSALGLPTCSASTESTVSPSRSRSSRQRRSAPGRTWRPSAFRSTSRPSLHRRRRRTCGRPSGTSR